MAHGPKAAKPTPTPVVPNPNSIRTEPQRGDSLNSPGRRRQSRRSPGSLAHRNPHSAPEMVTHGPRAQGGKAAGSLVQDDGPDPVHL